jgi:hypothetical protein
MVFENRIMRISAPKEDEVAGDWIRCNYELHNLYSSPNIIRVIKSRIWAGHAARMEEMRNAYKVLVKNLKGSGHSEDLGVVLR